jgi:hypothetical protein
MTFKTSTPVVQPAGDATKITTHTDLDTPTADRNNKAFTTLAAQLALRGHQLVRSDRQDGTVTYYVHCWGQVKHLPDLDAAAAFLRQIGGNHGA